MAVNYAPGPTQNPNALAMALMAAKTGGGESSGGSSPEEMALRKMMLEKLMGSVGDTSPVQHWTQGLARMANAGVAGYHMNKMIGDAKANEASTASTLGNLPGLSGGGSPTPQPTPQPSPGPMGAVSGMGASLAALLRGDGGEPKPAPMPQADMAETTRPPADIPGEVPLPPRHPGLQGPIRDYANSIAKIESGGRYDLKGPVTNKGDQALGKYQVMGNNLPQWSQAAFGRPVGKQEFLGNPKIQDQLFENRFGGYVNKYGPEGASKAWFAGEGGMKNPQARDQLGTSVASYAGRFSRGLGQSPQQPVQMAALGGGVPMPQGGGAPPAVQPQSQPPMQMAQAQPQQAPASRQSVQIPPEMATQIRTLIANPKTRAYGLQLYQQYAKPTESFEPVMGPDGKPALQRNSLTGKVEAYPQPKDSFEPVLDADGKPAAQRNTTTGKVEAIPQMGPKPDDISGLRKEIQTLPSYKNIAQAAPIYKSMTNAAGRDTRAADVNMIYGLAKIMDPASVVRESEMNVAQAVATLPQYLQANIASQLQATGRLSKEVREAIMEEAHSRVSAYRDMFDTDAKMYDGIVGRNRMNRADVIPDFGAFDPYKASAPGAVKPPSQNDPLGLR
jgi:hypothetical protein